MFDNKILRPSIKQHMETLNSLLSLSMRNIIDETTKPICFKHFTYYIDNSRRISEIHDPFLNLFGFTTDKIVQSSTQSQSGKLGENE